MKRQILSLLSVVTWFSYANLVAQPEKSLVLLYKFDEGQGTVAKDSSGNNNNGKISGATWENEGGNFILKFNGKASVTNDSIQGLKDQVTVAAWIFMAPEQPGPRSGIITFGKSDSLVRLFFYKLIKMYRFMVAPGKRVVMNTPSSFGVWHHLAATFDGKYARTYINGELIDTALAKGKGSISGSPLSIGSGLLGKMGEVAIYSKALNREEMEVLYSSAKRKYRMTFSDIKTGIILKQADYQAKIGVSGNFQIDKDGSSMYVQSLFSYPGVSIGWNSFGLTATGEKGWKPQVKKVSDSEALVQAQGNNYQISRKIALGIDRIRVEDTIKNISGQEIGVIVKNQLITPKLFEDCLLGGQNIGSLSRFPTNPTIFVRTDGCSFGVVANDNVSRIQMKAAAAINHVYFSLENIGLAPSMSITLKWAFYPLGKTADYFSMVNLIRRDWGSNFTIQGPFNFNSINYTIDRYSKRPEEFKQQLKRKPVNIFGLWPTLEHPTWNKMSRNEYRSTARATMAHFRQYQPNAKFLGSVSWGLVGYDVNKMTEGKKFQEFTDNYKGTAYPLIPKEITKIVDDSKFRWNDSLVRSPDGRIRMYIKPGTKDATSFSVYPTPGSGQEDFLMDQAKFLVEDVGLDGIYYDGFGPYARPFSYDKWDGISVEIDKANGKIIRKYSDTELAGIKSRVKIANYLLSKGKILVGNGGNSGSMEEQPIPAFRFIETTRGFRNRKLEPGTEPLLNDRMCGLQLGSPIALLGTHGSAEKVYYAVRTYLRHGLVCYLYISDFPPTGENSGEYGPFKHMFPITPVSLNKGWIEGKERIITCVSGKYTWKGSGEPAVYLFDRYGRNKTNNFKISKNNAGWEIKVKLADWDDIAIITQKQSDKEKDEDHAHQMNDPAAF